MEASFEEKSNKNDFNNGIGEAFEKYSGIFLSKLLQKESNTYFNIKFDIIEAINCIKANLIQKLPIELDVKNEIEIYLGIKELIKICNRYLDVAKAITKITEPSYEFSKKSESDSSNCILGKKFKSAQQNKKFKKNDFFTNKTIEEFDHGKNEIDSKEKINGKVINDEPNITALSDVFFTSKKFASEGKKKQISKNNNIKSNENTSNRTNSINESINNSSNYFNSGNDIDSIKDTTNTIKREKKRLVKGRIDVLITNVTKDQFKQITHTKYNKYFVSNYVKELPDKFNIIIESCINLSTEMNEKKNQIKKYYILSELIEKLYSKNKNYLEIYLTPLKQKIGNIELSCPYFAFIITINNAYNYFKIASKKFLEDKDNINCNLYIYYIKFKLNDNKIDVCENNDDDEDTIRQKFEKMEKEIADMKERILKLENYQLEKTSKIQITKEV